MRETASLNASLGASSDRQLPKDKGHMVRKIVWMKIERANGVSCQPWDIDESVQKKYPALVKPVEDYIQARMACRTEAEARAVEARILRPHLRELAGKTIARGEHREFSQYAHLELLKLAHGVERRVTRIPSLAPSRPFSRWRPGRSRVSSGDHTLNRQRQPLRPVEAARTTTYADRQRRAVELLGLAGPKPRLVLGDLAARVKAASEQRKTA